MPRFEPITRPEHLPPEGALETVVLEFKGRLQTVDRSETVDQWKVAKYVAAFANAVGGVLLVGADEDKKASTLARYRPLTEAESKVARDASSEAVENLCSPRPFVEMYNVARDGGVVVAMNVWPLPGQAVGVRTRGTDAFTFPVRTGADTTYLKPEQLSMLMIPELRRVLTLLWAIPENATVAYNTHGGRQEETRYSFVGVDEANNVIKLKAQQGSVFVLPLDFVRSVWRDESGLWHVTVVTAVAS
jgi:hypothetical protein